MMGARDLKWGRSTSAVEKRNAQSAALQKMQVSLRFYP